MSRRSLVSRIISNGLPVVFNGLTYLPDEGSVKSKLATMVIPSKHVSKLAAYTVDGRLKHFRE